MIIFRICLGAEGKYDPEHLKETHSQYDLTAEDFWEFLVLLKESLQGVGVGEDLIKAIFKNNILPL